MLNRDEFAEALASHVSQDNPTQYTVITLTPPVEEKRHASAAPVLTELAEIALRSSRALSGDLTAVIENRVAVYLHGASKDDSAAFVNRVRARWASRQRGSLKIESFPYPSGDPKLRTMIDVPQQR